MTTIILMPVPDEYFEIGDEIFDLLLDPKTPSQKNKVDRAAQLLVGAILEVLILDMIENVKMKPFAKKIILQVENVIQKTANALVHKVILKLSNKDLWPLVQYLRDLEVDYEDQRYLSFPLGDDAEKALIQAHEDIKNGDSDAAKKNFNEGLQNLLDQGLLLFYKEPMAMIKLNFVMRKVADFGYTAIHAAVKPAIHKIVDGMELDELESLKNYVDTLTLEID